MGGITQRPFIDTPTRRWLRRIVFGGFCLLFVAASAEHQDVELSAYASVGRYQLLPFSCGGSRVDQLREARDYSGSVRIPVSRSRPDAVVATLSVVQDTRIREFTHVESECHEIWGYDEEAAEDTGESVPADDYVCEDDLDFERTTLPPKRTVYRPSLRYSVLAGTGADFLELQFGLAALIDTSRSGIRNLPFGFLSKAHFLPAPSLMFRGNVGKYFYLQGSFFAESQYSILPIARFGLGPRTKHIRFWVSSAVAGAKTYDIGLAGQIPVYGMADLEFYDLKGLTIGGWAAMGPVHNSVRQWFAGGSLAYSFDPWKHETEPAVDMSSDATGEVPAPY